MAIVLRAAGFAVLSLALFGCAGGAGLVAPVGDAQPLPVAMAGRWMLSAPNAPPCGVEFRDGGNARSGTIVPDGGCPGKLYMSRRWSFADGALTIGAENDEILARLDYKGGVYEGKAADGTPLTLTPQGR